MFLACLATVLLTLTEGLSSFHFLNNHVGNQSWPYYRMTMSRFIKVQIVDEWMGGA